MSGARSVVRSIFLLRLAAALSTVTVAGCFPLAANYIHLDAPGIGHRPALCRDVGPPSIATWEAAGVRFRATLKPPFDSKRGDGYLQAWAPKGLDIRPAEAQGRIVRADGGAPAEIRFGLARRDDALPRYAAPVPPQGDVGRTFVFTGLPPIDFPGRLELPPMVVDGVTVPMPSFAFEVRPWAGIAPLNC